MDPLDVDHLRALVARRDARVGENLHGNFAARAASLAVASYYQGRIDEYCAQNEITQADADEHHLRDLMLEQLRWQRPVPA